MVALFKEMVSDVRDRRDLDTILAIATLAIALIFACTGATKNSLFNFIFLMNLAFTGWMMNVSWTAKKRGKATLLVLVGGALVLEVIQMWQFGNALGRLAELGDSVQNFQKMMQKN